MEEDVVIPCSPGVTNEHRVNRPQHHGAPRSHPRTSPPKISSGGNGRVAAKGRRLHRTHGDLNAQPTSSEVLAATIGNTTKESRIQRVGRSQSDAQPLLRRPRYTQSRRELRTPPVRRRRGREGGGGEGGHQARTHPVTLETINFTLNATPRDLGQDWLSPPATLMNSLVSTGVARLCYRTRDDTAMTRNYFVARMRANQTQAR